MTMKKAKTPKKKVKTEAVEEDKRAYLNVPLNQEYILRKSLAYMFKRLVGVCVDAPTIVTYGDYSPNDKTTFIEVNITFAVDRLDSDDMDRLTSLVNTDQWPGDGKDMFISFDIYATRWNPETNEQEPAVTEDGKPGFWLSIDVSVPKAMLDFKQLAP